jgi:hypothetical protein
MNISSKFRIDKKRRQRGYNLQLYRELKQARQTFRTLNDQWYQLKQRITDNNALLYVLCKKEKGQPIPSFATTVPSSRDEIDLVKLDHTKTQLLISGSDPGVVSTTVVNTSSKVRSLLVNGD